MERILERELEVYKFIIKVSYWKLCKRIENVC